MKKLMTLLLVLGSLISLNAQESSVLMNKNGVPILPEKGDIAIGINAASLLSIFKDGVSSPAFNFIDGNTFALKYFLSGKSALRTVFKIGSTNTKYGDTDFDNSTTRKKTDITVGAGYERRLGSGRIQGFFGGEGNFIYSKELTENSGGTPTADKHGLGFGLDVLIGSEYFIAPKLSLGGQFSWGFSYMSDTDDMNDSKEREMLLDLDNLGGAIMLTFHF